MRCPRDGISPKHNALVTLVIFQDRVRLCCQCVTIMSARVNVHRDHVRPLIEVLLTFRREFMLIILRPPVQITNASENEMLSLLL